MNNQKPWVTKDWFILLLAFAGGLKLFLSAFDIELPQAAIDGALDMIGAVVMFWGIWKNTHVSKKSQEQKQLLIDHNLD